jgi:hypothetical protein
MSILEKGRNIDVEGSLKEITEVIKSFYTDENLPQKTDLTIFQVVHMTKLDYKVKLEKEEFGYDSKLDEDIVIPLERRLVSHNRLGRVEGMDTLKAQLSQILMHPQTALRRMFGVD